MFEPWIREELTWDKHVALDRTWPNKVQKCDSDSRNILDDVECTSNNLKDIQHYLQGCEVIVLSRQIFYNTKTDIYMSLLWVVSFSPLFW